jgi:hypothetical protein
MSGGRRPPRRTALGAALLFAVALSRFAAADSHGWSEDFTPGRLDTSRWERTLAGDLRNWSVDVVAAEGSAPRSRLRLRADTRGTRDDTIKYLGVRTRQPIELRGDTRISVRLDWGDQANGSYLSAAVVLSPHPTLGNPLETSDWLRVAYVGVPPGRSARMLVGYATHGRERTVYTDGWPDVNPGGRRIGVQDLAVRVWNRTFEVREGERVVWTSQPDEIKLDPAYLYLQMSSHSNYPARSIYFERIHVQ